jgi:hypothetical protein
MIYQGRKNVEVAGYRARFREDSGGEAGEVLY